MKNIPIKFRGVAIKDYNGKPLEKKKFVYGNVWLNEDNSFALIGEHRSKKDGLCYNYEVEPDSICQLVGYDANGKEIYEGDILIGLEEREYIPTLDPMLIWSKDPNLKDWHIPLNRNEGFLKTFEKLEEFANKSDSKKLEKIVGKLGNIFFKNPQKMLKEFVESYCPFTLKEN